MIIDIVYDPCKSSRKIKRKSNELLGIRNLNKKYLEYRGMLIVYHKNGIRVNTMMADNADLSFLVQILNNLFKGENVGISGMRAGEALAGLEGVTVFRI